MQYDNISDVYDKFNDDFDYDKYLYDVFHRFPLRKNGLVLDCGCGTGVLIDKLSDKGYDCTGIDASEKMLEGAFERFERKGKQVHLVCQSLEEIDMYGAYDIVFCTLDTVNHILTVNGLKKFFKRLFNFTEPGGHFVFDIKTADSFEKSVIPNICEKNEDFLIVRGEFDGMHAWYDFTVFEKTDLGYDRYDDSVEERFYPPEVIKELLRKAGFAYKGCIKHKERIIFCAEKKEI